LNEWKGGNVDEICSALSLPEKEELNIPYMNA